MDSKLLSGVHVLVVEDTGDSRELFRVALEYCGALVTVADSCQQAKQILQSLRPHVVLTDISMPDDGVELLHCVQAFASEQRVRIPVVAITAHTGEFMRQHESAGFTSLLFKPVDPGDLCQAIADAYAQGGSRAVH